MPERQSKRTATTSSFDPSARTVEIVLATETPVRRRDFENGGLVDEVLVCSPAAIDAARIDSMPLLDGHRTASIQDRLGTVVPGSLRFERGAAIVTVQLSRNDKSEQVLRDLHDGHILNASAGYRVITAERSEAPRGAVATMRVTRWEPLELSIVQVPADPTATTRNLESEKMTDVQNRTADEAVIVDLATRSGMPWMAAEALRNNESLSDFRVRLIDKLAERDELTRVDGNVRAYGVSNDAEAAIHARSEALVSRMTGLPPKGHGAEFLGMSIIDHARGIVETTGVDTRHLSKDEVIGRAMQVRSGGMHTTSDFTILLQSAGRRVLMGAYEVAQSPLKTRISRASTAPDFRSKTMVKISDAGLLLKVGEHGEIKGTTRGEASQSYSLDTFARMFSISRQAIINDDLNAFGDWAAQAGRMAALTENKLLFELLTQSSGAGPMMGEDGKRMFHSDHENIGAPAALSVSSLSAARTAMRKKTAMDGKTRLNVQPAFLLVGPELETAAEQVLASIAAAKVSDVNPFSGGKLELLVESQLDGMGWYVFADPSSLPTFEHSYLAGAAGPQVQSKDNWEVLGASFRTFLDFGVGAVDHRGAYRNAGL